MTKSRKQPKKARKIRRVSRLKLRVAAQKVAAIAGVPRIGAEWQGGIYAGVARGVDGANDHHLIIAQVEPEPLAWPAAKKWAEGLSAGGHNDFSLPTRKEQALLFANVADLFKPTWYWSGEQHASDPEYAWGQGFVHGIQSYYRKGLDLRARAVRRLVIE